MCEDGKSYRTCLAPRNRNFRGWEPILKAGPGTKLEGFEVLRKDPKMIDADAIPQIVRNTEQTELFKKPLDKTPGASYN